MFCKLLILNYKITKNSEITNFLGYFLIPNWRIDWFGVLADSNKYGI